MSEYIFVRYDGFTGTMAGFDTAKEAVESAEGIWDRMTPQDRRGFAGNRSDEGAVFKVTDKNGRTVRDWLNPMWYIDMRVPEAWDLRSDVGDRIILKGDRDEDIGDRDFWDYLSKHIETHPDDEHVWHRMAWPPEAIDEVGWPDMGVQ